VRKCVTCSLLPPEGHAFCEVCWKAYEERGDRKEGCIRCGGGKGTNRVLCSECARVVRVLATQGVGSHGQSPLAVWGLAPPRKDPRPEPKAAFPHKCPKCGGAAYVGLFMIVCKGGCS
jgi:hypothetical protein